MTLTLRLVTPTRRTFGAKLRELRTLLHMPLSRLAHRSQIPIVSLMEYEEGRSEPRWSNFVALTKALGTPLHAFADCQPTVPMAQRWDD